MQIAVIKRNAEAQLKRADREAYNAAMFGMFER